MFGDRGETYKTELIGELADGTQYNFWTFNGTVPGSFIRARVGDEIELHLKNNENNTFPCVLYWVQILNLCHKK